MENHAINLREIGLRIQRVRQDMHMTQQELARRIDVSPAYVGHIERGMKKFSLDVTARICRSLGISADYLLFGRQSKENESTIICHYLEQQLTELRNSIDNRSTDG